MEKFKLTRLFADVSRLKQRVDARLRREEQFNVMTILRKPTDERYLHSRFIASILDPNAPHGMKEKFLRLFLEKLEVQGDFEYREDTFEIMPNYRTSSEDDHVDILLRDRYSRRAIIIENKINASDQQGQLTRYFVELRHQLRDDSNRDEDMFERIKVFYLTPDGHEPTEIAFELEKEKKEEYENECMPAEEEYDTLKNKLRESVRCISYEYHIFNWIKDCIDICDNSLVKNQLNNYKSILMATTNNKENVEERKELVRILGEGDNWKAAYYIVNNLKHIHWHVVDNFFLELFQKMGVAGFSKKEVEWIDNFAHKTRGKSTLNFSLEYKGCELRIIVPENNRDLLIKTKADGKELKKCEGLFSDENLFHLASADYRAEKIAEIITEINENCSLL